jgi:hypothetical protein
VDPRRKNVQEQGNKKASHTEKKGFTFGASRSGREGPHRATRDGKTRRKAHEIGKTSVAIEKIPRATPTTLEFYRFIYFLYFCLFF